jgi:hypothetical protein
VAELGVVEETLGEKSQSRRASGVDATGTVRLEEAVAEEEGVEEE